MDPYLILTIPLSNARYKHMLAYSPSGGRHIAPHDVVTVVSTSYSNAPHWMRNRQRRFNARVAANPSVWSRES
jgi:hypothetical protein